MIADGPASRSAPRLAAAYIPAWLVALAVGLVALAPRTVGLADFYTIDESYHWIGRVERFSAALAAGRWAETNQTGHPGVTTMWLGALGDALAGRLGVLNPGWAGGGAAYLALLRLPLAAANALAVAIGYLLLRRIISPGAALLGALLWATSPFLIAHGRLLHLDGLLTSFMTLSLLALLADQGRTTKDQGLTSAGEQAVSVAGQRPSKRTAVATVKPLVLGPWSLVLSAVFAGLALLTKAPSLLLLPAAGLIMLARPMPGVPLAARLVRVAGRYLAWLAVAAVLAFALWPALWVDPAGAVGAVLREIVDNGGQPHHSGNYFLGHPVGVPDARFYPAVVLWRTAPLTLLGLLAYLALSARDVATSRVVRGDGEHARLLALAGFALLFGLALTLQAKKLDRYLLPIFPALEILAAVGLVRLADLVAGAAPRLAGALRAGLSGAAALLVGATLLAYHPFYLSYFNPALGGGAVAERVMLVGLGEGMEQVGAWLSARPDLGRGDVLSWIPPTLAPFVPASTLVRDLRPEYLGRATSYAVLYVRSVQHEESAPAEAYVRQSPPLYSLSMHGVEYATVYQLPRPFAVPREARFEGVFLRGYTQELTAGTLMITPSWSIEADMPGGAVVFAHLLAPDGTRVAQLDAPLDQGMFAQWQLGQQFDAPLPLALPPDLPPGEYRVALGVYRPETGGRLALTEGPALPDALAGPHALDLLTVRLP